MRPTGLVDPEVEIRSVRTQVDDVLSEINTRVARGERVLITTLTKRMAEDLTEYLHEHGVQGALSALRHRNGRAHGDDPRPRLGKFDVLVGINLLREGLDMPEVSLVAILDADKEGFPALGRLADPDHRSRRAPSARPSHPVRRSDDGLDPARAARKPTAGAANRSSSTSATASRRAVSPRRCQDIMEGARAAAPGGGRAEARRGKRDGV